MDLQADESVGIVNRRIGLGVVQGRLAVQKNCDARTFGPNLILVPFALLLEHCDLGVVLNAITSDAGAGAGEELIAPRLVVKGTSVAISNIGLITDHLVGRIGRTEAAKLHAPVHEAFGACQLIFQRQAKVIEGAFGRQELVTRITGHRTTHDLAIFNAPDLGVAFPACERPSVEQRRRRRE